MTKQRCSDGGYLWFFTLTTVFLLAANCLFAAGQTGVSGQPGYIIYPLKHISVEQGKKYLAEVITGTVTHFPATSTLLITAEPSELTRAKAVLNLVDGTEKFVIKAIFPVSTARNMPSNEQIAAKLSPSLTRGVLIGSFSNPPGPNAGNKAIIDIRNDSVIAVAPVKLLDKIVYVMEQMQDSGRPEAKYMPKEQVKPESPAGPKVSELTEPGEARFLLTANDQVKTEPNTLTTNDQVKNEPNTLTANDQTKTEPNTATANGQVKTEPNTPAAVVKQEIPKPNVNKPAEDNQPPVDEEQVVNLSLADHQKLTVGEFLGLVGPYLHLDFLYDDKDVADEVTINPNGKYRGPIKVKDLYPMLEDVLKFKKLAMTRGKGNLVTIAPADNALEIDPELLETRQEAVTPGNVIVQRVVKLEYIDTTTAQNFLTGMKLTTNITAIPETKTLILTGYANRMSRIQALLDIVDKPGELKKFKFRQLQYTEAETLAPKIQSLAEQLGTVSITIAETSAEESPTLRIGPRRANETAAQYQARIRQAQAALARARATTKTTPTAAGAQPEAGKPTVYLDADERTNRILMIGLEDQLKQVEELIDTLDVARQDLRTLEIYKINNVDAEQVRKQLEELGIISPSLTSPYSSSRLTSGTKLPTTPTTTPPTTIPRTPISGAINPLTGESTTEALAGEPKVVIVEPTNSLLVNATAEQHAKIAEIISYVDAETDKQEIPYKVYPLENQSPDHLADVLKPLIEETTVDKEGKVQSVRQKQEEQITIVPDPNTFSLIVSASKKNQEWIKNLVEQLDKRRPQVLIDVTLVEISEENAFDYDLELISKIPSLEPGGQMTKVPAGNSALLSPFPSDQIAELSATLGANLVGGQGFYADKHIQALLTLMEKKGYGRVLAKPKILVNDNELGHIDTTNTIYVARSSESATTTGETVVRTSYTFDQFPSGIQLDITPHISQGSLLRLQIKMQRSSQTAPQGGIGANEPPPDKSENNIDTTVTVPDKSTIILGGIITVQQLKNNWKLPLLGDIPILGGLFRSVNNSSQHSKLYIFVKGEILRPEQTLAGLPDLERMSDRYKNAFEDFEGKFQNYQDWPGIKPKPMDPLKVLEDE
jgi:general secretion pathway protein D